MDVDEVEVENAVLDDEKVLLGMVLVLLLDNVEGEILEVVVLRSVVVLDLELVVLSDEEDEGVVVEEDEGEVLAVATTNPIVTTSDSLEDWGRASDTELGEADRGKEVIHLLVELELDGGGVVVLLGGGVVVVLEVVGSDEVVAVVVVMIREDEEVVLVLEVVELEVVLREVVFNVMLDMATMGGRCAAHSALQQQRYCRAHLAASVAATIRLRKREQKSSVAAGTTRS